MTTWSSRGGTPRVLEIVGLLNVFGSAGGAHPTPLSHAHASICSSIWSLLGALSSVLDSQAEVWAGGSRVGDRDFGVAYGPQT